MNKYTIQLPKNYPRQEALLSFLQKEISAHDTYNFEPSDDLGKPQCVKAKTDPDFVMTDQISGRQFGANCRHINEAIEKFESDIPPHPRI